jgi:MFS family permease
MQIGAMVLALGLGVLAVCGGATAPAVLGVLLISVGEIGVFPAENVVVDELAGPHLRGTYFGAFQLRILGMALGPVVGGALLEHAGGSAMFGVMAAAVLAGALIYVYATQATGNRAAASRATPS